MYKLVTNPNRILIVLVLAAGLAAAFYFPQQYPERIVEIPVLALFVGELGLALFLSLLCYENATPQQILKLSTAMFGLTMFVGAISNSVGQLTQMLPDYFVLVSWVQLIIMNTAGITSTLCFYRLHLPDESQALRSRLAEPIQVQPAAPRSEGPRSVTSDTSDSGPLSHDFTPPEVAAGEAASAEPKRTQSVKEILESLDISRIMRLERSIHPAEPPSLETLFKEESKAAEATAAAEAPVAAPSSNAVVLPTGKRPPEDQAFNFSPEEIKAIAMRNAPNESAIFAPEQAPFEPDLGLDEDQPITERLDLDQILGMEQSLMPDSAPDSHGLSRTLTEVSAGGEPTETASDRAPKSSEPKAIELPAAPEAVDLATIALEGSAESNANIIALAAALDLAPAATTQKAVPEPEPVALPAAKDAGSAPIPKTASGDEPDLDLIPLAAGESEGEAKVALAPGEPNEPVIALPAAASSTAEPQTLPKSSAKSKAEDQPLALPDQPSQSQPIVGSGLPSLQELLKTETLDGPLVPLEEAPEAYPQPVASTASTIAATDNTAFDEAAVAEDLDKAFKKLVPREALRDVSTETLRQLRESNAASKASDDDFTGASLSAPAASAEIADLIRSLAEEDLASEADQLEAAQLPQTMPQAAEPKEVKDFGRLSAKASAKSPVEQDTAGSMKTIGKMLIDTQAVENIIKQGEKRSGGMTTAKIVSAKRGEAIRSLLTYIDNYPGVTGSLIVGNDGLVISSTVDPALDKDLLGAMSMAIHGNSSIASDKLSLGELKEIVLWSPEKLTLLKKLDDGILAVYSDTPAISRLDGLLKLLSSLMRETTDKETAAASTGKDIAEPVKAPAPAAEKLAAAESPTASEPKAAGSAARPYVQPSQQQSPSKPAAAEADAGSADSSGNRIAVAADLVRDLIASLSVQQPEPAPAKPPESATAPASQGKEDAAAATAANQLAMTEKPPALKLEEPAKPSPVSAPANSQEEKSAALPASTSTPPAAQDVCEADSPAPPATPSQSVKEFGRLSASSGSHSVIDESSGSGSMSIGKMLLDVQAVSNIIKGADKRGNGLTTARVISAARGEGIRSLLSKVDTYPGVSGSLIVGHDGLVIASTLSSEFDKDTLGAMATSVHSHTNVTTTKLELGRLHQAVLQSSDNITVLTNVEVGVLAVFTKLRELEKLDGLLEAIDQTVQS
jgi:predicted regulator of Ras-like GTPase activity (Roadblock/LC7/MglB family)